MEKQQLIQAFKELNFELLHQLLDDNRSYMEVSKDLFLTTLKEKVAQETGLTAYEEVLEGVCEGCNKGCKGFSFRAKNQPSLDLLMEESNGKVSDIYLCIALKLEATDFITKGKSISFYFDEEDKFNFTPTVEYSINIQKIQQAIEEYAKLAKEGIMPIEGVANWYDKVDFLLEDLGWKNWDEQPNYKDFKHLKNLMSDVSFFVEKHKLNPAAKTALENYEIIRYIEERDIIQWLIDYEYLFDMSFDTLENWRETGFLKVNGDFSLVIDFNGHMDWLNFNDIYYDHYIPFFDKHVDCNLMFDLTDVPNADLLEILLGPKDFN